jgi:hypothetical protein
VKGRGRRTLIALLIGISASIDSDISHGQTKPDNGQSNPGLYVRGGVLLSKGKPFRAFGVNYFNAFYRTIKNPKDKSYKKGFAVLKKQNIPCFRFMASGYWPVDFKLYLEDKKQYFSLLDEFVKEAEKHKLGLIPSLFWYYAAVPDLVGESMNQWGNSKSKTNQFMRTYTREFVSRYKDSPAIWAWEFGNEYSLHVDLPNAAQHRPKVHPELGTAKSRSENDDLTHKNLGVALEEFAKEIRKLDKNRLIMTGNAIPRASAWHMSHNKSWDLDSKKQYRQILLRDNPDPFNSLSIHWYPGLNSKGQAKRFAGQKLGVAGVLKASMTIAKQAGKPLIVGEFGISQNDGTDKVVRSRFLDLMKAIDKSGVPLALLWVFDFSAQDTDWNVTAMNERAYQLQLIGKLNRRGKEK